MSIRWGFRIDVLVVSIGLWFGPGGSGIKGTSVFFVVEGEFSSEQIFPRDFTLSAESFKIVHKNEITWNISPA